MADTQLLTLMDAGWLFSPVFDIRWSTLAMALVILVAVGVAPRRPFTAIASTVAWAGVFEVANGACDIVIRHQWGDLGAWGWQAAALGGWAVLAAGLGVWPDWRWLLLTAAALAVWTLTGHDYNYHGQVKPLQVWPEVENVTAKTTLGIAYLMGALRAARPVSSPAPAPVPARAGP